MPGAVLASTPMAIDDRKQKWVCTGCGYVYDPDKGDPDNGVPPGTAWEDVPEDWVCPICYLGKDEFDPE